MLVDGNKVPYVEVAYEFARNPSSMTYSDIDVSSGAKLLRKRLGAVEIPIPVVYSRRGTDASWDAIIEHLGEILYTRNTLDISFSHGDGKFYRAHVISIEITEIHEYVAKGIIVIYSESPFRLKDEESVVVDGEANEIIYGQTSVPYRTKSIFTETATTYEFKFYRAGQDTSLRNINAIKINYQFTVGDKLVIDFSRRAVLLNDNDITNSLVILQSNFMELPVGEVVFEATEETEVFYNERYY